jgi:hypothetical protein
LLAAFEPPLEFARSTAAFVGAETPCVGADFDGAAVVTVAVAKPPFFTPPCDGATGPTFAVVAAVLALDEPLLAAALVPELTLAVLTAGLPLTDEGTNPEPSKTPPWHSSAEKLKQPLLLEWPPPYE